MGKRKYSTNIACKINFENYSFLKETKEGSIYRCKKCFQGLIVKINNGNNYQVKMKKGHSRNCCLIKRRISFKNQKKMKVQEKREEQNQKRILKYYDYYWKEKARQIARVGMASFRHRNYDTYAFFNDDSFSFYSFESKGSKISLRESNKVLKMKIKLKLIDPKVLEERKYNDLKKGLKNKKAYSWFER